MKHITATLENLDARENQLAIEGREALNRLEGEDYLELQVETIGTLIEFHARRQKIRETIFIN